MTLEWIEKASQEIQDQKKILSFEDYVELYKKEAPRESRPSYQYLLDMLQFYGQNDRGHYKLFEQSHPNYPAVYGQERIQEQLVSNLKNFQEEGYNNKFILLVGPNGSSKSSLVRKFMKGAEEYSKTDEGALYTFSWIFPIDSYIKGSLGLNKDTTETRELNSFAYLQDKEISAILSSELKDHPLLLIPLEYRHQVIEEAMVDFPEHLNTVRKSYLFKGDLSKRNRMIYDALLKNYKGKHSEVLKHIRVERYEISRRYSSSAVTIEPQIHVDAQMQQITMDKRLGSLPPSLQSLNLYSLKGEAIMANRGVLEFSDLLKRPMDTFKYLLQTMETSTLNLHGILTELDIFFIGTSNEVHLAAFKQHPDFNSFKGRFNFIKVPYLLDYVQEKRIYRSQIEGLKENSYFEPHALSALCLFAIMTRLRASLVKNFEDKSLANIATNLSPIEKTLFLSSKRLIPDRLNSESQQILSQSYSEIVNEFEFDNLYQGKFGISPRDLKNIIYKLTSRYETITFAEILEYLQKFVTKKNEYDFLNMTPQGDYHNPQKFIDSIKEHCIDLTDREIRDALGMIDNRSYEDHIRRYIQNVNAKIKGEKIKNPITGKYEESDDYIIKEFENSINLKEDQDKFRSHLISKMGAYYLDNPGKSISYHEVFPELMERLKESFRKEQKKVILNISKNLVFYEAELNEKDKNKPTPLSKGNREEIKTVLGSLQDNHGYSHRGALNILKYLIKERY